MRRRQFLAALPAVLAGCGGSTPSSNATDETRSDDGRTTGDGPTDTGTTGGETVPSAVETPAPGECTPDRPEFDASGEVRPEPYPDPPGEFTEASVRSYLVEFEVAYRSHRLHRRMRDSAFAPNLRPGNESVAVRSAGDGYLADVEVFRVLERVQRPTSTPETTPATPTVTVTEVSDTPANYQATYYLTDRFLVRYAPDGKGVEEQAVVACFDR